MAPSAERVRTLIAIVLGSVMLAVPLAMSTSMLNVYTTPKYLSLVVGGAALVPLLVAFALGRSSAAPFRSPFAIALFTLLVALAAASAASGDPRLSFFGTFTSRMGLVTYAAFAVCALAVLTVTQGNRIALGRLFVWHTTIGGVVALVCVLQIVGATNLYPSDFLLGATVPRVHGTVGHPDFAGNYLLTIVFPALCIAYAARGIVRCLGVAVAAMSTIGILYTGTRGAWVGLLAGTVVAAILVWRTRLLGDGTPLGKRMLAGGIALFVVASAALVALSPSAEPIRQRIAAFGTEGFTGAGRTTVWQFTLGLVPEFWTLGCGPDLFKVAQTPFKTLEYVQATSGVNIEDPHNAYMSMLMSGGVLALLAYVATIVVAVRRLPRAITSARSRDDASVGIGLAAAVSAMLAHDFFLHHLAVNGLAFFVVLALTYAWGRIPDHDAAPTDGLVHENAPVSTLFRWSAIAVVAVVVPVMVLHAWRVGAADANIARSLRASAAGDAATVSAAGDRAVGLGLPQPDYRFYYAVAIERLARASSSAADRQRYFDAAADQAVLAVEQPMPPAPYVAYASALATAAGRFDEARAALDRAERMDPFSYHVDLSAIQLLVAERRIDEAIDRFDRVEIMHSPEGEIDKARTLLRNAIRSQTSERTETQREFLRREFRVTGTRK